MTTDVFRWHCDNVLSMDLNPQGMWMLAEQAIAHEKAAVRQARQQAVRDCLAAIGDAQGTYCSVEISDGFELAYAEYEATSGYEVAYAECETAVRALLEGEKS